VNGVVEFARVREVFIAEHHSVSFYFCQENVGKVDVGPADELAARPRWKMSGATRGLPTRSAESPIQSYFDASKRRRLPKFAA
jgi:hypothetical protein